MHDIDFLPSEYHQNHTQRRWQTRRVFVVAILATMVAAAAFCQHQRRRRLEADLARCGPAYAAAVQTRDALSELQSRLQLAQASADLVTYLRHPWPRTQILAALLGPLPDEIAFEQLDIDRESATGPKPAESLSPADRKAKEKQEASLPPALRDLKRLREQYDSKRTIVTITGVTTDSAALHRYLGELGRQKLFSKAQLLSIETDSADTERISFSATLIVRPGYGQPGGPSGPNPQSAPRADRKAT